MSKIVFRAIAAFATLLTTQLSMATMVYEVSNTSQSDCSVGTTKYFHGLWTRNYLSDGDCPNYFSFQKGSQLEVDELAEKATLSAVARNPSGVIATIDVTFEGFAETYLPAKEGGGIEYIPDDPDWDFFQYVSEGIIFFTDSGGSSLGIFEIQLIGQTGQTPTGNHVFQIGEGANDKTADFGASGWLDARQLLLVPNSDDLSDPDFTYNDWQFVYSGAEFLGDNHWDFNITLEDPPGSSTVPVPGSGALLGVGLLGLFGLKTLRSRK